VSTRDFNDDGHCFVCGRDNPAGLGLEFRDHGQEVEAGVSFPDHLQGWKETVHGGLLATVLDETMIKAAAAQDIKCVTAEITVKYKAPASTGVRYRVLGKVLESHGRMVMAEASVVDESGRVYAQATGKLFKVR
jgi:uncharacterized protein (TIGR00369 family)